jgi:uncharacterized small protein (DUF1192 family)
MDDESEPRKLPAYSLGMSLDDMSVEELHEQIGVLENEIERLRDAISTKTDSRSAADAAFKL